MALTIALQDWKMKEKKDKSKTIAGTYAVMNGPIEIATKSFNDSDYGSDMQLAIPSALMVEAEALDAKIKAFIEASFGIE